jgi:hypothetical protein
MHVGEEMKRLLFFWFLSVMMGFELRSQESHFWTPHQIYCPEDPDSLCSILVLWFFLIRLDDVTSWLFWDW